LNINIFDGRFGRGGSGESLESAAGAPNKSCHRTVLSVAHDVAHFALTLIKYALERNTEKFRSVLAKFPVSSWRNLTANCIL
jgi:hypothetical protein